MYLIPSICNTFCEVQGKREQSPLLGSDTYPPLHTEGPFRHTDTEADSQHSLFQTDTDLDSCNRHTGGRRHKEQEGEHLNPDLPLAE